MKPLRILCDLDEIAAQLLVKWLGHYNADYDDHVSIADLTGYSIEEHTKIGDGIYDYIDRHGFFDDLIPVPGAQAAIAKLIADGHTVVFATSQSRNADSARAKIEWAQRHFKVSHKQVIPIHYKYFLKGDVFIDDSPAKIRAYREAWPEAHILSISYPYNQTARPDVNLMAESWQDHKGAWLQIYEYIDRLAKSSS